MLTQDLLDLLAIWKRLAEQCIQLMQDLLSMLAI